VYSNLVSELSEFMSNHDYNSVQQLIGLAVKN
jgi:dihydroorotate dehydrogenase